MLATVYGATSTFCDPGCRDSFREDRRHGLIYGSILIEGQIYSWEQGSLLSGQCAYCNAPTDD